MGHAFPGVISHTAAVTAPALTVIPPSAWFALSRDFPWNRVPGYIVVPAGRRYPAILHAIVNVSAHLRVYYPSVLGTASGAQNVGVIGAFGVAATSPWPACGAAPSRAPR